MTSQKFSFLILVSFNSLFLQAGFNTSGHIKAQALYASYNDDSIFYLQEGRESFNSEAEVRLNLKYRFERAPSWKLDIDYQLLALPEQNPSNISSEIFNTYTDEKRLLDLSKSISDHDPQLLHRLDRLNIGYNGEKFVFKLGRQALSWGNGLMFSTMDIINPFDVRVYDQEYKLGDDMLYMQYLFNNGGDLQLASVFRRNLQTGEHDKEQDSYAAKYHGFFGGYEFDVLVAEHYDNRLYGVAVNTSLGAALVYSELTYTKDEENYLASVLGINYSWLWLEHNISSALEWHYNEVGLQNEFTFNDILERADLYERILRGETTLAAQNYLGLNTRIEITPLLSGAANIFFNVEDQSALVQLSVYYDWKENSRLFFAASTPVGKVGGELSGLESEFPGLYLSSEVQAQTQISFYF